MGREIMLLHLGQAGVQMASAMWELFCLEHQLSPDGKHVSNPQAGEPVHMQTENIDSLFYETANAFVPRAVLVDLEPTVIDEIRFGPYRQLWNPKHMVSGKEDAASNYARGHYTIGRTCLEPTMNAVRKCCEATDNLTAFQLFHSQAGGTGSGMTALLLEQLSENYGKKFKLSASVFPSPVYSQSTVDPYNTILHTHASIETLDCGILVDNETLFNRCSRNLGVERPSFNLINRMLAMMLSTVVLSHRFVYQGSQQADITSLLTNLIPYPRIHFPMLFYAPLCSNTAALCETMSVPELTRAIFTSEAQTIACPSSTNAFISCAMLYRGVNGPRQIYDALTEIKSSPAVRQNQTSFVDWCPTGFKIGINVCPPMTVPNGDIPQTKRAVCMLAGNLGLRSVWKRNNDKFDIIFKRRSFVHWFISEGLEEGEFIEARDNMADLEKDYTSLMSEAVIDEPVGRTAARHNYETANPCEMIMNSASPHQRGKAASYAGVNSPHSGRPQLAEDDNVNCSMQRYRSGDTTRYGRNWTPSAVNLNRITPDAKMGRSSIIRLTPGAPSNDKGRTPCVAGCQGPVPRTRNVNSAVRFNSPGQNSVDVEGSTELEDTNRNQMLVDGVCDAVNDDYEYGRERERNRNNARLSQTLTESDFLRTGPLVDNTGELSADSISSSCYDDRTPDRLRRDARASGSASTNSSVTEMNTDQKQASSRTLGDSTLLDASSWRRPQTGYDRRSQLPTSVGLTTRNSGRNGADSLRRTQTFHNTTVDLSESKLDVQTGQTIPVETRRTSNTVVEESGSMTSSSSGRPSKHRSGLACKQPEAVHHGRHETSPPITTRMSCDSAAVVLSPIAPKHSVSQHVTTSSDHTALSGTSVIDDSTDANVKAPPSHRSHHHHHHHHRHQRRLHHHYHRHRREHHAQPQSDQGHRSDAADEDVAGVGASTRCGSATLVGVAAASHSRRHHRPSWTSPLAECRTGKSPMVVVETPDVSPPATPTPAARSDIFEISLSPQRSKERAVAPGYTGLQQYLRS